MTIGELRLLLLNNPKKELIIEIVNNSEVPLSIKLFVQTALVTMGQKEIESFSKLIAIALQYVEQKDMQGLEALGKRTGIPTKILETIMNYAANFTSQ